MTEPAQLATMAVSVVCGAMVVLNLSRLKHRGPRAYAMAAAFALFAGLVFALQYGAPIAVQAVLGVGLFFALAADAFLAPRRQRGRQ